MNQDKEWIKKEIAKILIKEGLMGEAFGQGGRHSDLWNTFVAPFTDIVKAAALSGQDILSAVKLNLDVLLAIDPDTVKAAHDKYDKRKEALDAKWKPLKDANAAAGGGDVALLAFAVNPGAFLGAKFAEKTLKTVPDVYTYMDEAGWSVPLRGLIPGAPEKPVETEGPKGILGTAKDVVGKLADIFFIAHHAPAGPMLSEEDGHDVTNVVSVTMHEGEDAEEEKPKQKIKDIDAEIENYFEETGLDKVFQEAADDLLDMREEMLDDLLSKVKPQLDMLLGLMEAATPEDFAQALEGAKEAGMAEAVPANFMQEFDAQAEELASDPKFKEELEKEKSGITEEEVLETAKKTAFSNSKEELQVQLEAGGEEIVKQALEAIEYDMPEEQDKKIIEKTPVGKQYYEIYEKAKSELMSYIS
mgnify:CR=1 FL=1